MSRAALRRRLEAALARPGTGSSDFDLAAEKPAFAAPRPAGVLAALAPDGRMILTRRASGLRHHAGQICLPGGKVETGDADPVAAALREADEEIGLPPDRVEVLGTLPPHLTVTGFSMVPVLGLIDGDFIPAPEAGEVAEAFAVPLDHIADLSNYRIERRLWRGDWRPYRVAPWGPYYIWGATARVLYGLAQRLRDTD